MIVRQSEPFRAFCSELEEEFLTQSVVKKAKARAKSGEKAYRVARDVLGDLEDLDEALEEISDALFESLEDALIERIS